MDRTILKLDGVWSLYITPNKEVKQNKLDPKTIAELDASIACKIEGSVPGNFELDMQRAGLLPDLFYGTNPLLAQKQENKHLWYARTFEYEGAEGEPYLLFEGLDTYADIYLNGELMGSCDNMLIAHELYAGALRIGTNELVVHIRPTAIEIRKFKNATLNKAQRYNFDSINVRKAAYMFGWDIMGRFVSGGIWKSVSIIEKKADRIDECYIGTRSIAYNKKLGKKVATLNVFIRLELSEDLLDGYRVVIRGKCKDKSFEHSFRPFDANTLTSINLEEYLLWWPKGRGEQNLYDVEVTLYLNGEVCDVYSTRVGIRTVRLERTSVIDPEKGGKFEFYVNEEKVFILGTNWVPLDSFPSQNSKRLDRALELVDSIGCNMLRCWGGNVYEEDRFYELCDEKGILIWQDFGMGCAIYPQTDEFCRAMAIEAEAVVKRLRSHPCLALWAGDNECDLAIGWGYKDQHIDPNMNIITRKLLPSVVLQHDPLRTFLPSSPYMDEYAFNTGLPMAEDHLWGPRDYFKGDYYAKAVSAFASETGYHGCPSPDSLKKYISPEQLWGNMRDNGRPNEDWIVHAAAMEIDNVSPYEYRIGLMNRQVVELFGEPTKDNVLAAKQLMDMFGEGEDGLAEYAKASQISQAEAFKYFIERFRIRKDVRGGIIWWNILDGWPQISDAVVDYYFVKKLAYWYIKNSQAPLCLMFDEPIDGKLSLVAVNDSREGAEISYTVTRASDGAQLMCGNALVEGDGLVRLGDVCCKDDDHEFLLIEWSDGNGNCGRNHFVTNIRGTSYTAYRDFLEKTQLGIFEGFGE